MKERQGLGSWYADGDREDLLRIYGDFNDDFVKILRFALPSCLASWLHTLPTWTRGRAILIGDAAHAMTPLDVSTTPRPTITHPAPPDDLQGQGANMFTEDAEAMRLFLQPGVTNNHVPAVLQRIDAVRRPKATQVLYNTCAVESDEDGQGAFMRSMDYSFRYDGVS